MTTRQHNDPFTAWRDDGTITAQQALDALTADLQEVDDVAKRADEAKRELRDKIGVLVATMGDRAVANGYELCITAPAQVVSFDTKGLEGLISELIAAGDYETAAAINKYRKVSGRTGGLRISKTKG